MGDIFRILDTQDFHFVVNELRYATCSKLVLKELGEPIIIEYGQTWILCYCEKELIGFMCYTKDKILYAYAFSEWRCKGVFNKMYESLPMQDWSTIASNMSYPIFIKKGFKVIKNYKTCHKLKLKV